MNFFVWCLHSLGLYVYTTPKGSINVNRVRHGRLNKNRIEYYIAHYSLSLKCATKKPVKHSGVSWMLWRPAPLNISAIFGIGQKKKYDQSRRGKK